MVIILNQISENKNTGKKMEKENKNKVLYELKKKNETTAVVLSLFLTGAGSMYAGKIGKGILILFSQIFLWMFLLGWLMWIIAPLVAYGDAKKYNSILALELNIEE